MSAHNINTPESPPLCIHVPSELEMDRLGEMIAGALVSGDCLLLDGPMGAGKSHLARAILRTRLDDADAEVPSPTYTLLNTYHDGVCEIHHGDFYRLTGGDEIAELGIDEAVNQGIVLLEWPDRWPSPPQRHLRIEIPPLEPEGRKLLFLARGDWTEMMHQLGDFE